MMNTLHKLYALLTAQQRRKSVFLLGLMIIGSVLETVSIGLVIPTLVLMTQVDITASYPQVQPLLQLLGNPSQNQLVSGGILTLFSLYFVKAIFLVFLTWKQNTFVYDARGILSQRLFTSYLRQPWTFHLQRNSGQLINILANETNLFSTSALLPAFVLLAEGLTFLGICTVLIIVEPLGVLLSISSLGLAAWGFQRLTQGHILRWGKARQYHEGLRVQYLQQGLGGVKEIKLLGREAGFLSQYSEHNLGSVRVVGLQNTLLQMPRLWLEVLAISGLSCLVLVMLWRGSPPAEIFPTISLFSIAAFRLMPSVNSMIRCLQSLRHAIPVIDTLHREIQLPDVMTPPSQSAKLLAFHKSISLSQVSYRYPKAEATGLIDVNLTISRGASIGFIGGSGAGKSTLVDVILGLLPPTKGQVKVDGIDIQTNLRSWQDQIGYVPQSVFLTDDSLRRNVAYGLPEDQIDDTAVQRAIKAAQLEGFIDSLSHGVHTFVGERGVRISGGQRQRIGIARALYHDPLVLVLDEATSALDSDTEQEVMDSVNALIGDKTLLIIAHRLSTVARCDWLYRLDQGKVVAEGSFDSLTKNTALNAK